MVVHTKSIIDITDTEALLVRSNDDGGDVFTVDTTNNQVRLPSGVMNISDTAAPAPTTNRLYSVSGDLFWDGFQLDTNSIASASLGIEDGTSASPTGLYFSSDLGGDTGFYRLGEDHVGFTTGGIDRLAISATGVHSTVNLIVEGTTSVISDSTTAFVVEQSDFSNVFVVDNSANPQVAVISGTESEPAYTFIADPDTGIFNPSENELAITVGSVEQVRINNAEALFYAETYVQNSAPTALFKTLSSNNASGVTVGGYQIETQPSRSGGIRFLHTGDSNRGFFIGNRYNGGGGVFLMTFQGSDTAFTNAGSNSNGLDIMMIDYGSTPQVQFTDGTNTNPAIAFINDTDIGLYRIEENNIGFTTGSVKRMNISSTGHNIEVPTNITVTDDKAFVVEDASGNDVLVVDTNGVTAITSETKMIIDVDDSEALHVRSDNDSQDTLVVDTLSGRQKTIIYDNPARSTYDNLTTEHYHTVVVYGRSVNNATGTNNTVGQEPVMAFGRHGEVGNTWDNWAEFAIGKYGSGSSNSQTQFDIRVTDGTIPAGTTPTTALSVSMARVQSETDLIATNGINKSFEVDVSTGKTTVGFGTENTATSFHNDGDTLLVFGSDRPWSFKQNGIDAGAALELNSNVDGKNFLITSGNGTTNFLFDVNDAVSGTFLDIYGTSPSTSKDSGALRVEGGAGFGNDCYIEDGNLTIHNTDDVAFLVEDTAGNNVFKVKTSVNPYVVVGDETIGDTAYDSSTALIVVDNSSINTAMYIKSSDTTGDRRGQIIFGDENAVQRSRFEFQHTTNSFVFTRIADSSTAFRILDAASDNIFLVNTVNAAEEVQVYGDFQTFVHDTSIPLFDVSRSTNDPILTVGSGSASNTTFRFTSSLTSRQYIYFDSSGGTDEGRIQYDHSGEYMQIYAEGAEKMRLTASAIFHYDTTIVQDLDPILQIRDNDTNVSLGQDIGRLEWFSLDTSVPNTGITAAIVCENDTPANRAFPAGRLKFIVYRDGAIYNTMTLTNAGELVIPGITDSTSPSTGSIVTSGGVGIAKDLYVGGGTISVGDNGELQFPNDSWTIGHNAIPKTGQIITARRTYVKVASGGSQGFQVQNQTEALFEIQSDLTDNPGCKVHHTAAATSTTTGGLTVAGGISTQDALYAEETSYIHTSSDEDRFLRIWSSFDGTNRQTGVQMGGKSTGSAPDTCWYAIADGTGNSLNVPFVIGYGTGGWVSGGSDDYIYLQGNTTESAKYIQMNKPTFVDSSTATAFQVRKAGDTGDVLTVNTSDTNPKIDIADISPSADGNPILRVNNTCIYSQYTVGLSSSGNTKWTWTCTVGSQASGSWREANIEIIASGCQNNGTNHGIRRLSGSLRKVTGSSAPWNLVTLENINAGGAPTITVDTTTSYTDTFVIDFDAPAGIDTNGYQLNVELRMSGLLYLTTVTTSLS